MYLVFIPHSNFSDQACFLQFSRRPLDLSDSFLRVYGAQLVDRQHWLLNTEKPFQTLLPLIHYAMNNLAELEAFLLPRFLAVGPGFRTDLSTITELPGVRRMNFSLRDFEYLLDSA